MLEDKQFGILMLDNILYGRKILFWTVSSTFTLTHNGMPSRNGSEKILILFLIKVEPFNWKKNTLYIPFMLECAYELQKKLQSYLSLKYRHDWWIMLNIDYF